MSCTIPRRCGRPSRWTGTEKESEKWKFALQPPYGIDLHVPLYQFALVLTRDPGGKRPPKALFSTDQMQTAEQIILDFMKRWSLENTFEESRAQLGIETRAPVVRSGD